MKLFQIFNSKIHKQHVEQSYLSIWIVSLHLNTTLRKRIILVIFYIPKKRAFDVPDRSGISLVGEQ